MDIFEKSQGLRISGPKPITHHGTFGTMVWSKAKQIGKAVQLPIVKKSGESLSGKKQASEGHDPKSRLEIWGRPEICATAHEAVPRQLVQ